MPDYKAMYYHLAGRMASAVDTLEATTTALQSVTVALDGTTNAFTVITEKLKLAQQTTEDMFINCDEDELNKPETENN